MSESKMEWQGITSEELVEAAQGFLTEAVAEYSDDHVLSAKEIAKCVAHLVKKLGDDATGLAAIGLHAVASLITAALPLIPGAD